MRDVFNINVDSLSEKELKYIRDVAKEMFNSGNYGGDMFKIAILAFLYWCGESGTEIQVNDTDRDNQKHYH